MNKTSLDDIGLEHGYKRQDVVVSGRF